MIHIFIVNPSAGVKNFADELRAKLEKIEGLQYFIFNTRVAGAETELVRKVLYFFRGEEIRVYCCGGSGTVRNMLDGFEKFDNVEIAFFPCGLTNDFLKMFGEEESRFHKIEELIFGDVIRVDYIQTNHGRALNTCSLGLDATMLEKLEEYRLMSVFGKNTPYILGLLYAVFIGRPQEYLCNIDGIEQNYNTSEMIMGNGKVLGGMMYFSESAEVADGLANYLFTPAVRGFRAIYHLSHITSKDFEKQHADMAHETGSRFEIRRKDGRPFRLNLDGELMEEQSEWIVEVVKRGLKLVVPKGVRL